jgi:lipoyl(octanoyl) transferase
MTSANGWEILRAWRCSSPVVRTNSERWRLIDTAPAPGAWNMAVDQALMQGVREGGAPVLRVYRWSPACLSLGRNQPARGEYREDRLARENVHTVRRLTGGRAVLHDRELTYSVTVGERALGSPRTAYAVINSSLVAALRHLGVDARLQPRPSTHATAPSLAPCFRDPAEGEVMVEGRKLIGSAQLRDRGVILQHGSLLLENDQRRIGDFLTGGAGEEEVAPAVLSGLLPRLPCWRELVEAITLGFGGTLGVELQATVLTAQETARASEIRVQHQDPAWVWRL